MVCKFFYYTTTSFMFSLAELMFRSEGVHEEIANVNDDKGVSIFCAFVVVHSFFGVKILLAQTTYL